MIPSPFDSNTYVEVNQLITVTNRTVRFSNTVYQTKNITSFSEGNIVTLEFPWTPVIIITLLGFMMASTDFRDVKGIGVSIMIVGVFGIIINLARPKQYGLLLALNSGDKKLFVSSDTKGLKNIISVIYDLIETDSEATYQVNISNSKIKGNFIQGVNSGSIDYR
jgi:hypothetical protein